MAGDPSQPSSPLGNLILKPARLSQAKLAQLLKWEPEKFGAIRVWSEIYFAIQMLKACYKTFINDTAKSDLVQSIPLKKQNQDRVKEVQLKVSSPHFLYVLLYGSPSVQKAFPDSRFL